MSATQAALDELDEATLDLILALQLEDVTSITQQDSGGDPPSLMMARSVCGALAQFCSAAPSRSHARGMYVYEARHHVYRA